MAPGRIPPVTDTGIVDPDTASVSGDDGRAPDPSRPPIPKLKVGPEVPNETCEQKKGPQRKTKFCSTWKNWKSGSLPACWAAAIRRRPPTRRTPRILKAAPSRRTIRATEALLDPAGAADSLGNAPSEVAVGAESHSVSLNRPVSEEATSFRLFF